MSNQGWAKLIYGRTLQVDFRFLALPQGMNDADATWILEYIRTPLRYPHDIKHNPCWCLFKNNTYCVIGAGCYVEDVLGKAETGPDGITHITDSANIRSNYFFVGYVAKLNQLQEGPQIPAYVDLHLDLFREHCELVRQCWQDKNYNKKVLTTLYDSNLPCSSGDTNDDIRTLNVDYKKVLLAPLKESNAMWLQATRSVQQARVEPLSLCIGLADSRAVQNGKFLNATAQTISQIQLLPKEDSGEVKEEEQQRRDGQRKAHSTETTKEIYNTSSEPTGSDFEPLAKLIWYMGCSALGYFALKSPPGLLIGAAIAATSDHFTDASKKLLIDVPSAVLEFFSSLVDVEPSRQEKNNRTSDTWQESSASGNIDSLNPYGMRKKRPPSSSKPDDESPWD